MKTSAIFILAISVLLAIFGYWGICTRSGRAHYDEMDGMIPFFAMILSGILFVAFLILTARMIYLKKKK